MPTPKPYTAKDGRVTWRVRFRHRGVNGSETFDTQPEADLFARDIETRGTSFALAQLEPTGERGAWTVDQYAESFFTHKAGRVRSDRTVTDYRRDYDRWIKPRFGRVIAEDVDAGMVQRWVDDMASGVIQSRNKRPLAPKSIADRHAILHGIFEHGCAAGRTERRLNANPCKGTDLPKRRKTAPKGLRPTEWQALHTALRQIDPEAADLAEFMLATGWRFSEATALSVADVEDNGTSIVVHMSRVVRRDSKDRFVIVDDSKSAAGMRSVKLDAAIAPMVRDRADAAMHTDSGLVFTTKTGAQWHYNHFRERAWNPAVKAAGLTARAPTPHWLRHTAVAWLVMSGKVSLPEIQRRIGHESIQTTINVYGRMIDDVSNEALDAFAAIRSGQGGPAALPPAVDGGA